MSRNNRIIRNRERNSNLFEMNSNKLKIFASILAIIVVITVIIVVICVKSKNNSKKVVSKVRI